MISHFNKKKYIKYIKNNLKLFLYRLKILFNLKKKRKLKLFILLKKKIGQLSGTVNIYQIKLTNNKNQ